MNFTLDWRTAILWNLRDSEAFWLFSLFPQTTASSGTFLLPLQGANLSRHTRPGGGSALLLAVSCVFVCQGFCSGHPEAEQVESGHFLKILFCALSKMCKNNLTCEQPEQGRRSETFSPSEGSKPTFLTRLLGVHVHTRAADSAQETLNTLGPLQHATTCRLR